MQHYRVKLSFGFSPITHPFHLIRFLAVLFIFTGLCFPHQESIAPGIVDYEKWLEEEVVHIITPREKKTFLQLKTDQDKMLFIKSFWKHRDPSPHTEKNEYKEEHYRRVIHANKQFGYGSSLPGCKTDRGKIFILLGPPHDVQSFEAYSSIRPTIVWFYQGMNETGLPDAFSIIFFKAHHVGEFKIYSPTLDGPQALLSSGSFLGTDSRSAFQTLLRVAPSLARISTSLIPGQTLDMESSPLASDSLLANINSLPLNRVNDEYAEKFLVYKDIIDVEYSANYFHNDSLVRVFRSPVGFYFVHYAVELDYHEPSDQDNSISPELIINGNITNQDGRSIYQYESSVPLMPGENLPNSDERTRISYQDMFPLIEGRYHFSLILRNEITKGFTSLERELEIPWTSMGRLSDLILCHNVNMDTPVNESRAFQIGNMQLFISAQPVFSPQQEIFFFFQINNSKEDPEIVHSYQWTLLRENVEVEKKRKEYIDVDHEYGIVEKIPREQLFPGHYLLGVTLYDKDGNEICSKKKEFQVSFRNVPRPTIYSTSFPPFDNAIYAALLGNQYLAQGELKEAEPLLQQAYIKDSSSLINALPYGRLLMNQKKYSEVLEVLSPFMQENVQDVLDLVARAHHVLGHFDKAIALYREYLNRFGQNSVVLALLGDCYSRTGNLKEAIKALEISLSIDPTQEKVKRLLESIKNDR
ncbi:MAG: GWxTD domain-containing protein [Acidobacteriota bacterium]|nr:GWxTD domain-containing protein [Acidobacteriota bacterium]